MTPFFFLYPISCTYVCPCRIIIIPVHILPVCSPHPCLQGHFDNTWCRRQAADSKLSISLSNGVTAGLCWPLNSLRWRRRPPAAAALVWHSLLAACLFSTSWSHFRVKIWIWERRTFNAWGLISFVARSSSRRQSWGFHPGCGLGAQPWSPSSSDCYSFDFWLPYFSQPVPDGTIKVVCICCVVSPLAS